MVNLTSNNLKKTYISIFLDLENIEETLLNQLQFMDAIEKWCKSKNFIPAYRVAHTAFRKKYDRYRELLKSKKYQIKITRNTGSDAADHSIIHGIYSRLSINNGFQEILIVSGDRIFSDFLKTVMINARIWVLSPNLKISAKIYRNIGTPHFLIWNGEVIDYWSWLCNLKKHAKIALAEGEFCSRCDSLPQPLVYCWNCENIILKCEDCGLKTRYNRAGNFLIR